MSDERLDEASKKKSLSKKNKIIRIGSAVAFLFLLAVGIHFFLDQGDKYVEEEKEQKEFIKIAKEEKKKGPEGLAKKYKDMVGWIKIPGTEFSYPVMQTGVKNHHKDDPEFYLHADVQGEYSFMGTPFLDSRCTTESDNLIIYGHNINGGRMFGYLQEYRQSSFYKEHPVICFTKCGSTKEEYDVVAVLITDIYSHMYTFTDVYTDTIYMENVEKLLDKSAYETEAGKELKNEIRIANVEEFFHKEKFITLSTCRTGEGRNSRLLIVAKRKNSLASDESISDMGSDGKDEGKEEESNGK